MVSDIIIYFKFNDYNMGKGKNNTLEYRILKYLSKNNNGEFIDIAEIEKIMNI